MVNFFLNHVHTEAKGTNQPALRLAIMGLSQIVLHFGQILMQHNN
jgi:hypothetical protein